MKVSCELCLVPYNPGDGMAPVPKTQYTKAVLSLGYGEDKFTKPILLITTQAGELNGTKIPLQKGGIVKVHMNFINEGKVMVRFKNPPKDLYIQKASPIELKTFLKTLEAVLVKLSDPKSAANLPYWRPGYCKNLTIKSDKLMICDSTKYNAIVTLPYHLTELTIANVGMTRIDPRIFKLSNLVYLNLSSNFLNEIPVELTRMSHLKTVDFCINEIRSLPSKLFQGPWLESVECLYLSENLIVTLPKEFFNFKRLQNLSLSSTGILALPYTLYKCAKTLQLLDLFKTDDLTLMTSIRDFVNIDLRIGDAYLIILDREPPFPEGLIKKEGHEICTLQELAKRTVANLGIFPKPGEFPQMLINQLHYPKRCDTCRKYCFENYTTKIVKDLPLRAASITDYCTKGHSYICVFCSRQCEEKFSIHG